MRSDEETPRIVNNREKRIFLSYSRKDEIALKLYKQLRENNFDVRIDQRNIKPGEKWREKIVEEIDSCDIFLLILTPNSIDSRYVPIELNLAHENGKAIIFPVFLETVDIPENMRLALSAPQRLELDQIDEEVYRNIVRTYTGKGLHHFFSFWARKGFQNIYQTRSQKNEQKKIDCIIISLLNSINSIKKTDKKSEAGNDKIKDDSIGTEPQGQSTKTGRKQPRLPQKKMMVVVCSFLAALVFPFVNNFWPHGNVNILGACDNNPKLLSCGEKKNFTSSSCETGNLKSENKGRQYLFNGKYEEAEQFLKSAWQSKDNLDPELLIALNNATVMKRIADDEDDLEEKDVFAIGVSSVFTGFPKNIIISILMGISTCQTDFNSKHKNKQMIIVMGNDKNDSKTAVKVAEAFIKKKNNLVGVIGPYSSEVTFSVIDKYRRKLPMVSATSTATQDAYLEEDSSLKLDWFFRPVSTTLSCADHLVRKLKEEGIKENLIFYHNEDLYLTSFLKNLEEQSEKNGIKTMPINYLSYSSDEQLERELVRLKGKHPKDKTVLTILSDAHNVPSSKKMRKLLVKHNKGYFQLVANNTILDNDLLEEIRKTGSNIRIATPWHPDNDDKLNDLQDEFDYFNINLKYVSDKYPLKIWAMVMAHDATEMLAKSATMQINSGEIDYSKARENLLNSAFLADGLTDRIQLSGIERSMQISSLVEYHCMENERCRWNKISDYKKLEGGEIIITPPLQE